MCPCENYWVLQHDTNQWVLHPNTSQGCCNPAQVNGSTGAKSWYKSMVPRELLSISRAQCPLTVHFSSRLGTDLCRK